MKSTLLSLSLTLLFFTAVAQYPQLNIGDEAPLQNKKMKGVDGTTLSLKEEAQTNGLLVLFSCNQCPFVQAWEDRYDDIKQWADKNTVGMVALNSNWAKRAGADSFDKMIIHAKEQNYRFPYLLDHESEMANAFGAQTTPHIFLFNSQMKLVYKGAIDDNFADAQKVKKEWLKDALNALGAGTEVIYKTTPPKGCGIKRK